MFNQPVNKILVIRFSSLGDVLLTTPILRALKQKFPSAQIDFLVRPKYSDVLKFNTGISNLINFETDLTAKIKYDLRIANYDLIIDLQNNYRSRKLLHGLQPKIYRFDKPTFKKLLLVWTKINLLKDIKTISQRYAETANVQLDEKGLDLIIPEKITSILDIRKNYVGICPGAKHFTKRWPAEYFIQLGNQITDFGFTIVIFGGKDDIDVCTEISSKIKNSINLCNNDQILQTAVDMKLCKLIICNDSGLMHTASAIGIPLIVLFGSTVKEFGFIPFKVNNLILENKMLSCRPCSHIGKSNCPQKHFKCMVDLKPQIVYEHSQQFLKGL